MEETRALKRKIYNNAIVYGLVFLAVAITPLIAAQAAKLLDFAVLEWWQHGQLRVFYTEVLTAVFWIAEMVGFHCLVKHLKKRQTNDTQDESSSRLSEEIAITKSEKKEKKHMPKEPLLPLKNVLALFGVCAVCVLLLSAQIGFQVKIFYDLGERVVLSEIIDFGGLVVKNIVKCVWIVVLIKVSFTMMEAALKNAAISEKAKLCLVWTGVLALVLLFGVYDVLYSANPFAWTYLFFYVAFTVMYVLTKRNFIKSYLLIFFVYLF